MVCGVWHVFVVLLTLHHLSKAFNQSMLTYFVFKLAHSVEKNLALFAEFRTYSFVAEKITLAGLSGLVCYGDGKDDPYVTLKEVRTLHGCILCISK